MTQDLSEFTTKDILDLIHKTIAEGIIVLKKGKPENGMVFEAGYAHGCFTRLHDQYEELVKRLGSIVQ